MKIQPLTETRDLVKIQYNRFLNSLLLNDLKILYKYYIMLVSVQQLFVQQSRQLNRGIPFIS